MSRRIFERVLSGQTAAIRLVGSVCYHSLCSAREIDVPWSAIGRAHGPAVEPISTTNAVIINFFENLVAASPV
jgi:hypothetical protein